MVFKNIFDYRFCYLFLLFLFIKNMNEIKKQIKKILGKNIFLILSFSLNNLSCYYTHNLHVLITTKQKLDWFLEKVFGPHSKKFF